MKTILKIWNGQSNQEAIHRKRIERIDTKERKNKENEEIREKFYNCLSKEQDKLYKDYDWTRGEEWCEEVDQAFLDGFRMGASLMIEVLKED